MIHAIKLINDHYVMIQINKTIEQNLLLSCKLGSFKTYKIEKKKLKAKQKKRNNKKGTNIKWKFFYF